MTETMAPLPKRRTIQSRMFDSTRWDHVKPREDDIIVATWAKSGTTLTQQIVSQLADASLIDEFQIVVNPVILGAGRTLFASVARRLTLTLKATRTFANGKVMVSYEPA